MVGRFWKMLYESGLIVVPMNDKARKLNIQVINLIGSALCSKT